jgi:hypothetical protein
MKDKEMKFQDVKVPHTTRPVGVGLRKKPKDLSGSDSSEREERGHGKGVWVYPILSLL